MYLDDRQQAWGYEDSPPMTTPVAEPFRAGRYVILQHVGHGAMGNVYAAYDPDLDRKVAVKVLRDGGRPLPASLAREAKAMAKLTHVHVVAVHDVGTCDRGVFVAMEFVDGVTLRTWLKGQKRDWREVMAVFRRAGEGLAAAHAAGVVHHDFKPDNVLVGGDGAVVKVADFGLARVALGTAAAVSGELLDGDAATTRASGAAAGSGTGGGVSATQASERGPVGTLAYMAPERHALRAADARSDQFSFCVALYEALYAQRPYAGSDVAELRQAVMHGAPAEPPKGTPVPGRVWAALRRGLSRAPEERFPGMAALLAALAEPRRPGLQWALTAGLVVAASGVMLAAQPAEDRCAAATAEADAWWSGQDAPAAVGAWFAGWRARTQATCAEGLVGQIAADLRLAREACLGQQLAVVQALAREATAVPDQAAALWAEVPASDECDDPAILTAVAPPAFERRGEVAGLREGLAAVAAAEVAGDYRRDRVEALVARAAALGYAPLTAEATYQRGRLEHYGGASAQAIETLLAAIDEAEAQRHDRLAADAWGFLVEVAAIAGRDELAGWQRRAEAANRRLTAGSRTGAVDGEDPRRVHPGLARGLVALRAGDRERAAAAFREALAGEGLHPLTRMKLQVDLAIALGEGEAAEAAWATALAAAEDPRVASAHRGRAWVERGEALFWFERYAEAGAAYAKGVALLTDSSAAPQYAALRAAHRGIAIAGVIAFDLEEAGVHVAAAERAAAQGGLAADPGLAEVAFEVHLLSGRPDEARRIAAAALAQLREQGAPPADRAMAHARLGEAMSWLGDADAEREFAAALAVLADASPAAPDDTAAYAYKGRGLRALRAGAYAAAAADLTRATELWAATPCDCREAAEAELALGTLYTRRGDPRGAALRAAADGFFVAHGAAAEGHRDRFVGWIDGSKKGRP